VAAQAEGGRGEDRREAWEEREGKRHRRNRQIFSWRRAGAGEGGERERQRRMVRIVGGGGGVAGWREG
jgi:hypothetical protein